MSSALTGRVASHYSFAAAFSVPSIIAYAERMEHYVVEEILGVFVFHFAIRVAV